jgi:hypothetical protein
MGQSDKWRAIMQQLFVAHKVLAGAPVAAAASRTACQRNPRSTLPAATLYRGILALIFLRDRT